MNEHRSADPVLRKAVRLKPVKGGRRECWVVLMWDAEQQAEIVIGARTKAECIRQARRIVPCAEHEFDPTKVYRALFGKVKP